ncbi:hypothetical protein [Bifidobacterium leontopitheci]|uniref:Lipoprotein n=1 Tax=Bifidobacterium leontopitheci TaxID=2650774 RepID=A0A6I1GDX4_9BIFI|nr:hypothetical protein [Bifidobacterium leontopitheci]KAB7789843.1 hypothetical protein F7D09_1635 [Bifidobacterium leontopitheci]
MGTRTTADTHAAVRLKSILMLAVLLSITLMLGGCRNTTSSGTRTVSVRDITLGEAVAAAYLTSAGEYDYSKKTGYLALISNDGTYTLAKNAGMQLGRLSWTKDGLFIADAQYDYLIHDTDKADVIDSAKTSPYQDGLIAREDSAAHIAAYNVGFAGDGAYEEDIVITDGSRSNRKRIVTRSYMPQMAACGGNVYGLQTALPDDPDVSERGGVRLISLMDGEHITATTVKVNTNIMTGSSRSTSNIPCRDNTMTFISTQYSDKGISTEPDATPLNHDPNDYIFSDASGAKQYHTIERWNVTNGTRTVIPLTDEQGKPLRYSANSMVGAAYDERSLQDGHFYWASGDGEILDTDVATGRTRIVVSAAVETETGSDDGIDFWQAHPRMVDFQPGHVDIWQRPHIDDDNGDARLMRYDLISGKKVRDIRVQGLVRFMENQDLADTGFAVRPE